MIAIVHWQHQYVVAHAENPSATPLPLGHRPHEVGETGISAMKQGARNGARHFSLLRAVKKPRERGFPLAANASYFPSPGTLPSTPLT